MISNKISYLLFISLLVFHTNSGQAGTPLNSLSLYHEMKLNQLMDYKVFKYAIDGYNKIPVKKPILTVIDFTKPSTSKRLFVIDLKLKKLLLSTHVAHGKNSGNNYATSFSNTPSSYKSSLGFFLTEQTYQGKNGYSLILEGLEKGINDRAKERAIVIHGADYCDPSLVSSRGRLGRSLGCPALPRQVSRKVIDLIKEGSLLFIFGKDIRYEKQSPILSAPLQHALHPSP